MTERWRFLVEAILFALLRGLKEGMVMIKRGDLYFTGPEMGVRGHEWFGWYHFLTVMMFAAFTAAIASFVVYRCTMVFRWLFIAGVLVLVWQCTEMGENVARYGQLVAAHEHVNFADMVSINLDGWSAYLIHAVRVCLGGALLVVSQRSRK